MMKTAAFLLPCLVLLFAACNNSPTITGYQTTYTKALLLNVSPPLNTLLKETDTIKATLKIEFKDTFDFEHYSLITIKIQYRPDSTLPNDSYQHSVGCEGQVFARTDTVTISCPVADLKGRPIQYKPLMFRFDMIADYDCSNAICFDWLVLTEDMGYEGVQGW